MRRWAIGLAVLLIGTATGFADAPETSLRPIARADIVAAPGVQRALTAGLALLAAPAARLPKLRPALRPLSEQVMAAAARPVSAELLRPGTSLRPWVRPPGIVEKALAKKRARRKGSVCGDLEIQGEVVGYVPGRIKACGIKDAVRVRSVSGVTLSQRPLINCRTARALKTWVDTGVKPAFSRMGAISELKIVAHYACRTRNNRKGARISEHGKGNAVDVAAFRLKNGKEITVLKGWGQGRTRKALRQAHRAACGPFGTVLGPNADRYHRDHFHFDTARHRGGPYCR